MSFLKIEDIAYLDVGYLDNEKLEKTLLSDLTVIAPLGTPAVEVAKAMDSRRGGVVVVVSRKGEPIGVLMPNSFLGEVQRLGIDASALQHAVFEIEDRLVGRVVEHDISRHFRPRFLYARPPDDTYCERGEHFADGNPCSKHLFG